MITVQAPHWPSPQPNFGPPASTTTNYRAGFNGPEVHRTEEIRLDHNFTTTHLAFLRYENRKDDYQIPGARSTLPPTTVGTSDNIRRVNFWTFGDIIAIRPNMVNEARVGAVILVSASTADFLGQTLAGQLADPAQMAGRLERPATQGRVFRGFQLHDDAGQV